VHPQAQRSLVPSRDANDSAERLNALASYRGIYLSLDCFGGLVTELLRRESIDLLGGWLSGASKHDPLQGDEKNPFHKVSPILTIMS
jgi:hypothetical protein